jgi:hypothetical protein
MMSKINISFDTKDKKLTCTMDGVELPSVYAVHAYKYEDYKDDEVIDFRVEMKTEDEENGVCYYNLLTANELEVKKGIASEVPDSDGLYAYKSSKSKISEDANKMMGRV